MNLQAIGFMAILALPLIGLADEKKQSLPHGDDNSALKSCLSAIDKDLALIGPRTNIDCSAPEVPVSYQLLSQYPSHLKEDLELSKAELTNTVTDSKEFEKRFWLTIQKDAMAQQLLARLNALSIPVQFQDVNGNRDCSSAAALYYPSSDQRIVLCVKGGKTFDRTLDDFVHEALHAIQYGKGDPKAALTFDTPGGSYRSEKALQYTMDPKHVDNEFHVMQKQNGLLSRIPEAVQKELNPLNEALTDIEKLFYINPVKTGDKFELRFTAKKPANISIEKFHDSVEQLLGKGGVLPSAAKKSGLVFHLPLMNAWLQKQPENVHLLTRQNQIKHYLNELSGRYTTLMASLQVQSDPKARQSISELMQIYYQKENRVSPHISTYCMEMQANMQTALRGLFRKSRLDKIADCRPFASNASSGMLPSQYLLPGFSVSENFRDVDQAIEIATEEKISKSLVYGKKFSLLYGYSGFPELFNKANCALHNPGYSEYPPQ